MTLLQAKKLFKSLYAKYENIEHKNSEIITKCSEKWFELYGLKVVNKHSDELLYKEDREYGFVEYKNKHMALTSREVLIHNVNHYRVAPKRRRLLSEFGLGASPEALLDDDDVDVNNLLVVSQKKAKEEEDLVWTLDFICAANDNYLLHILDMPRQDKIGIEKQAKNIKALFEMGLIDKNGQATKTLNPN